MEEAGRASSANRQAEKEGEEAVAARIVVIEDDEGMRESLRDLLALEKWECDVAETGRQGLKVVRKNSPSLIVLDLQLPDVTGYQLCAHFRKDPKTRKIPIVMISGRFTEPTDRIQGFDLGADEYFTKPFDPVYFLARVKSLLRNSETSNN